MRGGLGVIIITITVTITVISMTIITIGSSNRRFIGRANG